MGEWGGDCTCPDGEVYEVGDNLDSCGSLACRGGTAGKCNRKKGRWSRRKVICGLRIGKEFIKKEDESEIEEEKEEKKEEDEDEVEEENNVFSDGSGSEKAEEAKAEKSEKKDK